MNGAAFAACRFLFRLALVPAPAEFRRTYATRMFDILIDDVTEANRRRGRLAGVVACVRCCADGLSASASERVETIARALKFAARSLLRAPLLTFVSVAAIALAIAANLVVASVLDGVLLRPLPFANPQQLLFVQESDAFRTMSYPDARELAGRIDPFAQLTIANFDHRTLWDAGQARALAGSIVSPNYFALLGVHPSLGRSLSQEDEGRRNVVISYDLWRTTFDGDPHAVGRALRLDDRDYTIVGVGPPHFRDPTPYGLIDRDYWIAIDPRDPKLASSTEFNFNGIARVRSDFAVAAGADNVRAALSSVMRGRAKLQSSVCCVAASTVLDAIVGPVRPLLWSLYALVTLVLLIACANVANLQFTRYAAREGEFAVRAALGATPGRIAADVTTETLLVVVAGAALGLALAPLGIAAFAQLGVRILPRWENVGIDRGLLLYALALVAIATVLAGSLPALFQRRDIAARLGAWHATERRSVKRARRALVVIEIALATSLVIAAGLVTRSELAFTHVDLGFDPKNVFVLSADLTGPRYRSDDAQLRFTDQVASHLRAIPGVASVAASSQIPLGCCNSQGVSFPGRSNRETSILYTAITPEYFRTLRIPLIRGRLLRGGDNAAAPCVALVDVTFARRYLSLSSAVGTILNTSGSRPLCTVVGIVGAVREGFGKPVEPMLYVALAQSTELNYFIVRTAGENPRLGNEIAAAFRAADPTVPVPAMTSYDSILSDGTLSVRANTALFGTLAGLALVLALSGIFAVTSFSVEKRTQEFGIRRAVGAPTTAILRDVLGGVLAQCGAGVALGIVIGAFLSRFLANLLYETSPFDPATFAATIVLFITCSTVAAFVPAVKATRVEPAVALRRS